MSRDMSREPDLCLKYVGCKDKIASVCLLSYGHMCAHHYWKADDVLASFRTHGVCSEGHSGCHTVGGTCQVCSGIKARLQIERLHKALSSEEPNDSPQVAISRLFTTPLRVHNRSRHNNSGEAIT